MDKPVSKDPHNKGFALVVALSLMILLTVVAVGLLTLSSISLRSSSQGVAQAAAQANARMALMIAIGELQKQLGPDQRVSANGAILATTTVQHPNWAGVWNSWQAGTQAAGTTSPDTPSEHRTILGAGNNGMSPTYEAQRGDHFRAWLVSLSQNQAADISSAMSLSLTGTAKPSATDNAVQLVGLKSLGPEANVADHVKVGLLPIQSSGSATTASGRYGWWVGDESQKARIMGDSYKLNPTSTLADRLFRHTAPGSTGTVVAKGLEAVTDETRLGNLPTLETMNLLEGATGKPSRNFHNVTPFSRAVLADVREGGLKRDLTTLLERPIDPDEVYNYTTVNLGPPFKRVTSLKPKADDFMLYRFDSGTGEAAVPVQDLAAYYQLYDSSRPTGRDGMKYSSSPVSNLLPNGLQVPAPDYGNNTDTSKYLRNYTTLYRRGTHGRRDRRNTRQYRHPQAPARYHSLGHLVEPEQRADCHELQPRQPLSLYRDAAAQQHPVPDPLEQEQRTIRLQRRRSHDLGFPRGRWRQSQHLQPPVLGEQPHCLQAGRSQGVLAALDPRRVVVFQTRG